MKGHMRTTKTWHQIYMPDAISAKLDALTANPDAWTALLSDALTVWLERQGAAELDTRFGPRFNRLSRAQERTNRKVNTLIETVGLYGQHQQTLAAHRPPFAPAPRPASIRSGSDWERPRSKVGTLTAIDEAKP